MSAPVGLRTVAPGGDQRVVTIDLEDTSTLALGELAELAELSGMPLDELTYRLRPHDGTPPASADVIRVALALAVVIERRTDPSLGMADARRWDIRVVTVDPDPTPRARARKRSSRA